MKFTWTLNMNAKAYQTIFVIIAMTFTIYNVYERFFTKKVKVPAILHWFPVHWTVSNSISIELLWIISHCICFIDVRFESHPKVKCLPDPGVSGVRSMGPGVCLSLPTYGSFVKLCWCDSDWWWYQLNTIDDANLKRSLAIRNQCHICKSH